MPLGMEVGRDPGHIVLDGDSAPPNRGHSPPDPILGPCLLWQNSCMYGTEVGLSLSDSVRWGPSSPSPKGAQPPQFSANVRCGQTAKWTKMPLGMEVGLGPGEFVLDGDPSPPEKNGTAPSQFLAQVYCGQTAGWIRWIKMPLGTEVNLGPGVVVLDGVAAPPKRAQPQFSARLLWPNGWMDKDAIWYESINLGPGHIVLHGDPVLPAKGAQQPPLFGP